MKKFIIFLTVLAIFICLHNIASAQNVKKIEILHADVAKPSKEIGKDVKRLIGNVSFKHEDAYMYCDSAWFHFKQEEIQSFGNVRIEQGDSLDIKSDYLSYDGQTKFAKMRGNVVLTNNDSRLLTDSLDFDRKENIAYYYDGGEIFHEDIHLISKLGYYYSDNNNYYAVDSVILEHPDYNLISDSLLYNNKDEISYFLDNSTIWMDSTKIVCQNGWYNFKLKTSTFGEHTYIYNGNQIMSADSIFFDNENSKGKAWKNVHILDTAESIAASGNYAQFNDTEDLAFLTDSALVMYFDENKDTTYIHGDTVFIKNRSTDTAKIYAYNHVQIFSEQMQGRCDSLVYDKNDSISLMYGSPVLWANESQITSDTIKLLLKDNKAEKVFLDETALIIMQEDSLRFSQIAGKNMIVFLENNELSQVNVSSNAETIYYAVDDETDEIIGVNKEVGDEMHIFRNEGEIKRIDFIGAPKGEFLPDGEVDHIEIRLKNFIWLDDFRPQYLHEIFLWRD